MESEDKTILKTFCFQKLNGFSLRSEQCKDMFFLQLLTNLSYSVFMKKNKKTKQKFHIENI